MNKAERLLSDKLAKLRTSLEDLNAQVIASISGAEAKKQFPTETSVLANRSAWLAAVLEGQPSKLDALKTSTKMARSSLQRSGSSGASLGQRHSRACSHCVGLFLSLEDLAASQGPVQESLLFYLHDIPSSKMPDIVIMQAPKQKCRVRSEPPAFR